MRLSGNYLSCVKLKLLKEWRSMKVSLLPWKKWWKRRAQNHRTLIVHTPNLSKVIYKTNRELAWLPTLSQSLEAHSPHSWGSQMTYFQNRPSSRMQLGLVYRNQKCLKSCNQGQLLPPMSRSRLMSILWTRSMTTCRELWRTKATSLKCPTPLSSHKARNASQPRSASAIKSSMSSLPTAKSKTMARTSCLKSWRSRRAWSALTWAVTH